MRRAKIHITPRTTFVLVCSVLFCCVFAVWVYRTRPFMLLPWEAQGELSFLIYAKPTADEQDEQFILGFDDMTLFRADGTLIPVHATPRIPLHTPPFFESVVANEVPAGSYVGIRFSLRSPEIHNAWQGDTAPEGVALLHNIIELPISFSVHQDTTTVLLAGFETETALHPHDGERVYLPVIALEVREKGNVTKTTDGTEISGGTLTLSTLYGMQWDGTMRRNIRASQEPGTNIDAETVEQTLPVERSGALQIATSSAETETETNAASTTPTGNDSATTSVYTPSIDTPAPSQNPEVIDQPSP